MNQNGGVFKYYFGLWITMPRHSGVKDLYCFVVVKCQGKKTKAGFPHSQQVLFLIFK